LEVSGEVFVGGFWVLPRRKVRILLGLGSNLEMTSSMTPNKTLTIRIDEPTLNHPNKYLTLKNSGHQASTPTKFSPKMLRVPIADAPTKLSPIKQRPTMHPQQISHLQFESSTAPPQHKAHLGHIRAGRTTK